MGIAEGFGAFLNGLPLVRCLWRWLWERRLEIEFHSPISHLPSFGPNEDDTPILTVHIRPANPHIHAWLNLTVVNHRTDRPERIQSVELHLKKRRLWFWRETIAQTVASEHTHTASGVSSRHSVHRLADRAHVRQADALDLGGRPDTGRPPIATAVDGVGPAFQVGRADAPNESHVEEIQAQSDGRAPILGGGSRAQTQQQEK